MTIQWWQILLLTLYAGYQIIDQLTFSTGMYSPVFAGLFTGLVMGDVAAGLLIGASMQLTVLGVGTWGGASVIDANSGTVLAVAFSVALGMDPEQAIAVIAVPVASLMIQMDVLGRFCNTYFAHRIDKDIDNFNYRAIERDYLLGAVPWALSRAIPVFLALCFGGTFVAAVVEVLNGPLKWLGDGLSVAGAALPGVGLAILLRFLPTKKSWMYLVLGFTITALLSTLFGSVQEVAGGLSALNPDFAGVYNSLPMLGIALIGFALAALSYSNNAKKEAMAAAGPAPALNDDGEIEDDEL